MRVGDCKEMDVFAYTNRYGIEHIPVNDVQRSINTKIGNTHSPRDMGSPGQAEGGPLAGGGRAYIATSCRREEMREWWWHDRQRRGQKRP